MHWLNFYVARNAGFPLLSGGISGEEFGFIDMGAAGGCGSEASEAGADGGCEEFDGETAASPALPAAGSG